MTKKPSRARIWTDAYQDDDDKGPERAQLGLDRLSYLSSIAWKHRNG